MPSTHLDPARLEAVFQATLAVAAEADDWKDRELGPIHLLKYAYLADLAFAESGDGSTYTGTPWRFFNFGPWCEQAFARLDPALSALQVQTRSLVGDRGQSLRYKMEPGRLDTLAAGLPTVVVNALRRAVREFGNDTNDLLNHVYTTEPMLKAAPGEPLVFSPKALPAQVDPTEMTPAPPRKASKAQRDKIAALRAEMARRLAKPRRGRISMPPPRYDEVFDRGREWLETLAGEPISKGSFEGLIGDEVWKSTARSRHAD